MKHFDFRRKLIPIVLSLLIIASTAAFPLGADAATLQIPSTRAYSNNFSDVSQQDWFYPYVAAAYNTGLVNGTSQTTFAPAGSITIAQSLAAACRLHSICFGGTGAFNESGTWYQVYVDYAAANGIWSSPASQAAGASYYNRPAYRSEYAAMMAHAVPQNLLSPRIEVADGAVSDVPMSSAYAAEIYQLYRSGILEGSGNGCFNPSKTIKRSEACVILSKIADPGLRNIPEPFDASTLMKSSQVLSARSIPAYSETDVLAINGGIPTFSEEDKKAPACEYYGALDWLGRCTGAAACIGKELMPSGTRGSIGSIQPSGWQTVRYDDLVDGKYLYNRCHLIGWQLTGENANPQNLITGTRSLNTGAMLYYEDLTANYIKRTGNHVLYRSVPIFDGKDLVAKGVHLEGYSVEDGGKGVCFNVFCYNVQPGIGINYADGSSWITAVPDRSISVPEEPKPQAQTYMLNKNTKKFHYPECSSVNQMSEKNKWLFEGTREEVLKMNYVPCLRCNP